MQWLRKARPTKLMTCARCGKAHRVEDMHVTYGRPDLYFALGDHTREQHWAETDDFAQLGEERFFIRCVAEIAVIGKTERFGYGIWVEVPEDNYNRYADVFFDDRQGAEPPFAGSLANHLPMYDPTTLGLPVRVQLRDGRVRPGVTVTSQAHPLALEQKGGISFERLLDITHSI